ncbi:MAG: leucine-rich repeat protein [Clostridiales bacterium]|nr:leucine-rich repeat protein [Clostridiales bacterium]
MQNTKTIKVIGIILSIVFLLLSINIISMAKSKTDIGDFTYELLEDGCAKITGLKYNQHILPSVMQVAQVDIPTEIDGYIVKIIGENAFENMSFLRLTIPESVVTIEKGAFCNNPILKSIDFSNGLKRIEEYAFIGCGALERIEFPDSLVELGHDSFACTALKEIELTAENVGSGAFSECSSLEKVKMSDDVKNIEMCAFYGCTSLTEIVVGRNTKCLGTALFQGCVNLKRILIPKSVTIFGENNILSKDVYLDAIYGFKGSAAENYANAKEITFIDITKAYSDGDINLDSIADESDFEYILQTTITDGFFSEIEKAIADVNGDGVVDGFDASVIERMINRY